MSASHCKMETIFEYSWPHVVQAFWQRYPNPTSSHVLTEDTIKREVRAGKLYSRRLISKTNAVPKWGERFYRNTPVMIMEDSVLDLKNKTFTTFTRNIGLQKIMKVTEIVYYTSQNEGCQTKAVRLACVTSQVSGLSRAICAFGIKRFKTNCQKAALGFNYVLQCMFPCGQQLPPLSPRLLMCFNYAAAQQKLFWLRAMINSHRLSHANWRCCCCLSQQRSPATTTTTNAVLGSARIRQMIKRKWDDKDAMFKALRERLRCHSPYRKWLMSNETLACSRIAYLQFFKNFSYGQFCKK